MISTRKKITLLFTAFLCSMLTAFGQAVIDLNFQGLLSISGEKIASEDFDFTVKLISSESGKSELWSYSAATKTDEDGWLTFTIPEISQYLDMEGNERNSVVIRMEFLPNSHTKWMKEGEDFLVTYTLTPTLKDDAVYLKMKRMEGTDLTVHLEDHLYAFKDDYPFAYLTGGFLLTDAPPLSKTSIDDLRQWISPDSSEIESETRGVKGGFPKGGYRKR
jgi:hypothetical protein